MSFGEALAVLAVATAIGWAFLFTVAIRIKSGIEQADDAETSERLPEDLR